MRTTTTLAEPPSATDWLVTENRNPGPSSSWIVSTAEVGAPSRAGLPAGTASVRLTVSAGSMIASFAMGTVKTMLVTPAAKVSVPDFAV